MSPSTEDTARQSSGTTRRSIEELVRRARADGSLDGIDGKRKYPRFLASFSLDVMLDPARPHQTTSVKMHNVSEGGMAFWARQHIPLHRHLLIRTFNSEGPTEWMPVCVCHCTRGLMGHLVGVEFEVDSPEK